MTSLITRVKSTVFITTRRASMSALDGGYASLLHGRSLDFEDLRSYQYGDPARDIDWRATARHGAPLVKRSRATRMHTVLFVVDTGRTMTALARDETPKKDLAILAAGVLGLLALRHGDRIALVHGDSDRAHTLPPGRSEGALERALQKIDNATAQSAVAGQIDVLLDHVSRFVAQRMIVVVITDDAPVSASAERVLRRLRVQHDLIWITIHDAVPVLTTHSPRPRKDVISGWSVPDFVHGNQAVIDELTEHAEQESERRARLLTKLEISHTSISGQADAVNGVLRLANRRAHARR